METEVHVYAFSIAANVLLSFFPFLIVILSVCVHLLGAGVAYSVIDLAIGDYFGDTLGSFISRSLPNRYHVTLPVVSLLLLLFTANGIFEPLEVALNRVWGITRNRSFFRNQLVSLGLIFVCGSLAMLSAIFTGMTSYHFVRLIFFKMAAIPVSIVMLFLIYWLLPNRKLPWRDVVHPAVIIGLALEVLKYLNLLTWPLLRVKLAREYGPFVYSVTIVLWSFLSAMLILAGAEWSARRARETAAARELRRNLALPG